MDNATRKRLAKELLCVLREDPKPGHEGEALFLWRQVWWGLKEAARAGRWWPEGLDALSLSSRRSRSITKVLDLGDLPVSEWSWFLYEPLKARLEEVANADAPEVEAPEVSDDFAPGSGSNWPDREGGPRIVEGVRVVVPSGFRDGGITPGWNDHMTKVAGTVGVVGGSRFHKGCVCVSIDGGWWFYHRRDLVLFDVGKERVIRWLTGPNPTVVPKERDWLLRAGVISMPNGPRGAYVIDDARVQRILDSLDALGERQGSPKAGPPPEPMPGTRRGDLSDQINPLISQIETIFHGAVAMGDEETARRAYRARVGVALAESRESQLTHRDIEERTDFNLGLGAVSELWDFVTDAIRGVSPIRDAKTLQAAREQLDWLKRGEEKRPTPTPSPERFQCYQGLGHDHPPLEPGLGPLTRDIDE
jgi:hypothetical protein